MVAGLRKTQGVKRPEPYVRLCSARCLHKRSPIRSLAVEIKNSTICIGPQTLLTGEPSCKDEARIGQKNGLVRQWARRGTRPRQPADQRYENAYLFGAICPAKGKGAALALPYADTEMMQLHLDEISRHVEKGAHAVLLLDRAGWHTTGKLAMPKNITPILLPSRAPELNPVENVWQYLRQNWLSNRVFENYDAIIDAACDAWRRLVDQPETITSIGMRNWAHVGHAS